MGRKRFLTIVGSLMIGVVSLIIVYLSLILTNVIVLTQADIEITTADAYKEYDGSGRLIAEQIGESNVKTRYVYNPNGTLKAKIDRNGNKTALVHHLGKRRLLDILF